MLNPVFYFSIMLVLALQCTALFATERVALLPFAEPNSTESARTLFDRKLRQRLMRRGFYVVPEDSVANVLRQLRIRNTASPIESELSGVADSLDVSLILAGTIHRFSIDSIFSEATVCARLILAENSQVIWNNCITVTGGGEHALLSKPVHKSREQLVGSATKKLLSSLRVNRKSPRDAVSELVVKGHNGKTQISCKAIAVIPPRDESEVSFSGELFADFLTAALWQRGLNVVDQGQVRNVMLQCEDLRYGQSVTEVSQSLADSLGVDLVVTGTVSAFTSTHSISLGSSPESAIELRMIDAKSNLVVWAKNLRSNGDARKSLFNSGIIHSPAVLAQQMIQDEIGDLKIIRRRRNATPN